MSTRVYQSFLSDLLKAGLLGTSGLASAPSATPTVRARGLTSAYTFDPADDVDGDLAGTTTIVQELAGEEASEVSFTDSVLSLADGGPGELGANGTDVEQIAISVDHGSWTRLICHIASFYGDPFAVLDGDSPEFQWSRLGAGIFRLVPYDDEGAVFYPYFIEQCMAAIIGGSARTSLPSSATIKCDLFTAAAELQPGSRFLSSLDDTWYARTDAGAAPTIGGLSVNLEDDDKVYVDGNDVTFSSAEGGTAAKVGIWIDTGDPETSILAMLFDLPEPKVLNGEDFVLEFAATLGRIVRMVAA